MHYHGAHDKPWKEKIKSSLLDVILFHTKVYKYILQIKRPVEQGIYLRV